MKISLRQGIVSTYKVGPNPQFCLPSTNANFVDFQVSPEPTVVAFAHGSSNYLQSLNTDVLRAWGPIVQGVDNYLYWEIDLLTSQLKYKLTTQIPAVSVIEPANPAADKHWFDLTTTTMKVWNGAKWVPKVAVFAARVVGGATSNIVHYPDGASQVALNGPTEAGFIMVDEQLRPLRYSNMEFLTTASAVRIKTTSGTSGILAIPPNAFIPVRATENIPAFSLVYFSGSDSVGLASSNPALLTPKTPIGVVQEDLSTNEVGDVTQSGEIQWDQWDWSAHIGKPLYCGLNGEITHVRPNGLLAYRVGFVKNRNTILFQIDAETQPQIYQAQTNDVIVNGIAPISTTFSTNGIGERIWTVEASLATDTSAGFMSPAQVTELINLDTRLDQAEIDISNRSLLGHVHSISQVTGLQDALDGKSDVGHNHDLVYAPISHSHVILDVAGLQTALNAKEATIAAGTTAQYWRGDKTWVNLPAPFVIGSIDQHTDVDTVSTAPTLGDALVWDNTNWVPGTITVPEFQPSLKSITFQFGNEPFTFGLNVGGVAQYAADYSGYISGFMSGNAIQLNGIWDSTYVIGNEPTYSLNATEDKARLLFQSTNFFIGAASMSQTGASYFYEVLINEVLSTTEYVVGYWVQGSGAAFDPGNAGPGGDNAILSGGPSGWTISSFAGSTSGLDPIGVGTRIGVAVDVDSLQVAFFIDGSYIGTVTTIAAGGYALAGVNFVS